MGTHLKQRGKVFYFRRAVPFELQSFFRCTELWKSTGSSRKSEARLLSRLMAADFDRIVFLVKGGILNKKENRDALQEICDDFRREHRLDKPGVSSEDQEYIDDLTHRHLLDRLGQIDTTRSRGIPQVHCAFFGANEDAPSSNPATDDQADVRVLVGNQQNSVVVFGSSDQLVQYCQEAISYLQSQLSSAEITPHLIDRANKVLDELDDNRVPRHPSMVYDDIVNDLIPNPGSPPPLFYTLCLVLIRTEIAYHKEEIKRLRGAYSPLRERAQKAKSEAPRRLRQPPHPRYRLRVKNRLHPRSSSARLLINGFTGTKSRTAPTTKQLIHTRRPQGNS